jgi:hypothetical protein
MIRGQFFEPSSSSTQSRFVENNYVWRKSYDFETRVDNRIVGVPRSARNVFRR